MGVENLPSSSPFFIFIFIFSLSRANGEHEAKDERGKRRAQR